MLWKQRLSSSFSFCLLLAQDLGQWKCSANVCSRIYKDRSSSYSLRTDYASCLSFFYACHCQIQILREKHINTFTTVKYNPRHTENRPVFATHGFNRGRIVILLQQHATAFAIKTTQRSPGPNLTVFNKTEKFKYFTEESGNRTY